MGGGSQFFDITDDVARYVISQKSVIEKCFRNTYLTDEMFLQTIVINSDLYDRININKNEKKEHPYIQQIYLDINRAIDWMRGKPYVWKEEDTDILLNSGCIFARKFDYDNYPEIVDILFENVKER